MQSPFKKLYLSDSLDPYYNLAFEEYMIREKRDPEPSLFVWRSKPTMVIGRFQIPEKECNLELMKEDGVLLARRKSGGGTVYHDEGNINFTFFHPTRDFHKEVNLAFMFQLLEELGVKVKLGEKSDLLIEKNGRDYKVSGSAFKQTKDYSYHHMTLLVETDLARLSKYTKPFDPRFIDKSVNSRRVEVANVALVIDSVQIGVKNLFTNSCVNQVLNFDFSTFCGILSEQDWILNSGPSYFLQIKENG
jgi:lipoate---protein ligase